MGSHLNFKNFGDAPSMEGIGSKPLGNFPLARQSSIYSLTFDELQNTFGGLGKDFGSMNMDELLKNISTAEETQAIMTASVPGGEGSLSGGNLQRQGSLTLPRTLSQKTVDEVWRDLMKEYDGAKDGSSGGGGTNLPQRQQTLGEMTLEEFLARAGVVREDMQQIGMPNNSGFFGNNSGLAIGLQQTNRNNGFLSNNNSVLNQPSRLPLNMSGVKSSQPQQQQQQQQPQQQQKQQPQPQLQPLFPKQQTVAFATSMHLINAAQLASPGTRGSVVGIGDPSMNSNLVQSSGLQSGGMRIVGLGSPASQISSDVISKNSVDTTSFSPVPCVFGRGRKCSAALEKVVERRQRRMIKNRESAARSRARKQAYTLELEAEVAKLKEMNQELQKKQEEMMEMQKNQMLQTLNRPRGGKRQCLRRTLTGPW
ncbi:ABSCISIC ACID-INSENSITIVE 5-like protein 7 [Durio zibethinus]|uniref:ABSCISIC ACID-INSENSITIVE 5-like protein 7 n=1 Tax=Durio zibethinus TaxID=66656 RepID=A0A6P6AET1_DURZI|nr:ABSCISIC ACID-INSENSITIVE 5-like protein 7 [Durio zibethinus]XP_022763381.1 ABSCISIC ACID-INSENSITIVE 5-like protein 7 [Durio zibethinus]XP_022763382.1 ABSCISIC ACID-INSENSITIVE 5-like protein 7 [Durio zibethinus]